MANVYQGNLAGIQEIDLGAYYIIDWVIITATSVGVRVNELTSTDPKSVYNFGYFGLGSFLGYGTPPLNGYHMSPRYYVDWLDQAFKIDLYDAQNKLIVVFGIDCAADVLVWGH